MQPFRDFPKLESPFIREEIDGEYVVTPQINQDCSWVLTDEGVIAVEKLDGTNVSIVIEDGHIKTVLNRANIIPFFGSKRHIIEGILESKERGYCELPDGQWFGELIGPKVNGNPLKVDGHVWIPFNTYAKEHLCYKSFQKYPKTFENLRDWLLKPIEDGGIFSLFMRRRSLMQKPEGIVFYHPDGRMAKLRIDMYKGFKDKRHKEAEV